MIMRLCYYLFYYVLIVYGFWKKKILSKVKGHKFSLIPMLIFLKLWQPLKNFQKPNFLNRIFHAEYDGHTDLNNHTSYLLFKINLYNLIFYKLNLVKY